MGKNYYKYLKKISVFALITISAVQLVGCKNLNFWTSNENVIAVTTVSSYTNTRCDEVWDVFAENTINSPVYWLRVMQCSYMVTGKDAQARAKVYTGNEWHSVFIRSILINQIKNNEQERRLATTLLEKQQQNVPEVIKPLTMLWLENQHNVFSLQTEKSRAVRLKDKYESEIEKLDADITDLKLKIHLLQNIDNNYNAKREQQLTKSNELNKSDIIKQKIPEGTNKPENSTHENNANIIESGTKTENSTKEQSANKRESLNEIKNSNEVKSINNSVSLNEPENIMEVTSKTGSDNIIESIKAKQNEDDVVINNTKTDSGKPDPNVTVSSEAGFNELDITENK